MTYWKPCSNKAMVGRGVPPSRFAFKWNGVRLVCPCVPRDTAWRIVIPNGVTNIESAAFYRCESLRSVELPDSIETVAAVASVLCAAASLMSSAAECDAGTLRLLSYNVRHCSGKEGSIHYSQTAAAIQREAPDFVGLQEIDVVTKRSKGVDQCASGGKPVFLTGDLNATPTSLLVEKMEGQGGARHAGLDDIRPQTRVCVGGGRGATADRALQ